MSSIEKIIGILRADGKWDYAKLVQIAKLLGGPRKAVRKFSGVLLALGAPIVVVAWEGGKKFIKTLYGRNKNVSSEKMQEIEEKTQAYLSEVEKRKQSGLDTEALDSEYNSYMESTLNETGEHKQDDR